MKTHNAASFRGVGDTSLVEFSEEEKNTIVCALNNIARYYWKDAHTYKEIGERRLHQQFERQAEAAEALDEALRAVWGF